MKLSQEQANRIVMNGGAVIHPGDPANPWWYDGKYVRAGYLRRSIGVQVHVKDTIAHPDFPPELFALTFPYILRGPEAEQLLKSAPVGMLWGCCILDNNYEYVWEDHSAEYYDGQNFTGGSYKWLLTEKYEVRIRPGWLESQKIALPFYGFCLNPKKIQVYLEGKEYTFPWSGSGTECVKIWHKAPAGMLEWMYSEQAYWHQHPPSGQWSGFYHLRIRADWQAGDILNAEQSWERIHQGWVVGAGDVQWALKDGEVVIVNGYDPGLTITKHEWIESPCTDSPLIRYEPWRLGKDGYLWNGKEAAAALQAGMEGRRNVWSDENLWLSQTAWINSGERENAVSWREREILDEGYKWALRWPVKEQTMEGAISTGQAIDILLLGGVVKDKDGDLWRMKGDGFQVYEDDSWGEGNDRLWKYAPFYRVKDIDYEDLTFSSGLSVRCYYDRIIADVQGCGIWSSTKRKYEVALLLKNYEGESIEDFAVRETLGSPGVITQYGVNVENQEILFKEIQECIDACNSIELKINKKV